tara:strand:+ start:1423 stop:2217 length:795 start_codon:yes stop_codon:yes gene_type:complete
MAYPKITVNTGLALEVIASNLPIPPPALPTVEGTSTGVGSGTADGNVTNELVDSTANFVSTVAPLPVVIGDLAIELGSGNSAAVTAVAATALTLASDVFPLGTETYAIVKASHLTVAGETFITKGVIIGDIVWNDTANTTTTVTAVNSETDLTLADDLFGSNTTYNDGYEIFLGGPHSNGSSTISNSSDGCLLYVGSSASILQDITAGAGTADPRYVNIQVITTAGNTITFENFPVGNYLPIQITHLLPFSTSTAALNTCIAIW